MQRVKLLLMNHFSHPPLCSFLFGRQRIFLLQASKQRSLLAFLPHNKSIKTNTKGEVTIGNKNQQQQWRRGLLRDRAGMEATLEATPSFLRKRNKKMEGNHERLACRSRCPPPCLHTTPLLGATALLRKQRIMKTNDWLCELLAQKVSQAPYPRSEDRSTASSQTVPSKTPFWNSSIQSSPLSVSFTTSRSTSRKHTINPPPPICGLLVYWVCFLCPR